MSAVAAAGAAVINFAAASCLLLVARLWLRRATDYNRRVRSNVLRSSRQSCPQSERVVRAGGAGLLAAMGVAVALATAISLLMK